MARSNIQMMRIGFVIAAIISVGIGLAASRWDIALGAILGILLGWAVIERVAHGTNDAEGGPQSQPR